MRKLLAFSLMLGILAGCQSRQDSVPEESSDQQSDKQLKYPIPVAATVGMVADLVKNVGREYVAVTQIMGSGVDPHMHKASRDDVQTIMNSDMVFYSGLMLEGKMADTLIKVARNKPVFAVTELIDQKTLLEPDDFNGHYDPHVWMDVATWSLCVDAVKDALSRYDPRHAADYQKNADDYKQQLNTLHEYGLKVIQSIPQNSRILITSHDAFNYFGRAYGLEVLGVQGISTESEAGLKRINELVDLLVAKDVKAVFVESSVSKKNITALIDGAKAQGHEIIIGGELFSDAMGEAGSYEGSYMGMLDHNFTIVARALGGTAPEKGMQGKLTP
ncbi:zinc ABC transporter substrate-binding protein [Gimesia sp.]|uniref:metal ABC transporter solute-binding protein, Zn/Mn family n=1 Tax=Gimesia sp. TaxID=2024833 RepID=UPI000C60FC85|nr:zinc ABC transporter substrate-binding protein [Gimesia sp.]MAX36966.1 manganese transporter [Gimesia sp.]HAH45887.1 manganese transporter [Planctomycetaceae bacterium]|tara:strand:- start:7713 stop:8705 length:993 start_codon:yes stop_codon:yes gene_type:complete